MMKSVRFALVFVASLLFYSCKDHHDTLPAINNQDIQNFTSKFMEVMVHDITNPPLAARFFAYTFLAGYEVISQNDSTFGSMSATLNEYPIIAKPAIEGYSTSLSAILAMMETAKKLQPSGSLIDIYERQFLDSCLQSGYPTAVIQNSLAYAEEISKHILAYAKADHYNKISTFPRYTPIEKEGHWYPTPPAYFAAVEPHFNTVRPFTLDSATQFKPQPPVSFSTDKDSPFYQMMLEVYQTSIQLTQEQRMIASFWDCNPFAMNDSGHLMVGLKKISPGAHWMGITGIACGKAQKSFAESVKIHTIVAIGLMDAFLSCWDEKFRSNRIRPETAIRKYIDSSWEPLLQTPPFPEYTSGHSTISGASAYILTHYLGDHFHFTDTVEVSYGLPARDFPSFLEAAKEAAISRLYGGIHYRDANESGIEQGMKIGAHVIKKIEKISPEALANIE